MAERNDMTAALVTAYTSPQLAAKGRQGCG